MATRQITVRPDELPILLMTTLRFAADQVQMGNLAVIDGLLQRASELHLGLKEALAAMPKTNSATEGKRA